MRTYGRTYDANGNATWVVVETDPQGFNDGVYLTTLCQVLQLNPGESPFFANYGVPSQQSIVTQVFPDFYMMRTQQQFTPLFPALSIKKVPLPAPYYDITVLTNKGALINQKVPT